MNDVLRSSRQRFLEGHATAAMEQLDVYLDAGDGDLSSLVDAECMREAFACLHGEEKRDMGPVRSAEHQRYRWYTQAARSLERRTGIDTAILKLHHILRDDPNFVVAHLGLAVAYYQREQYRESIAQYRSVLELAGDAAPPVTRVGLALCAIRLDRRDLARKWIARALELIPDYVVALMALLLVEAASRDWAAVSRLVKKLYKIAPTNTMVMLRFADYLLTKTVAQSAITSHSTEHPTSASHDAALTFVCQLLQSAEASVSGSGPPQDRKRGFAAFLMGRLQYFQGQLSDAKKKYREAIALMGNSCVAPQLFLARLLYQEGNSNAALALLRQLDAPGSVDKDVLISLAAIHHKRGNTARAGWYMQRLAGELAPTDPSMWWTLAFAARHHPAVARVYLNRYRILSKERTAASAVPPRDAESWEADVSASTLAGDRAGLEEAVRSCSQRSIGDLAATPTELAQVLASSIKTLPAFYNLALLLIAPALRLPRPASLTLAEAADVTIAEVVMMTIVKLNPSFPDACFVLAELSLARRNPASAFRWTSIILMQNPHDAHAHTLIAKAYCDAGRTREAGAVLRRARLQKSPVVSVARGSLLLWASQQLSTDAPSYIVGARSQFVTALKSDPHNAFAAHGLCCCEGVAGVKREREGVIDQCLLWLTSIPLTDGRGAASSTNHYLQLLRRAGSTKRSIDVLRSLPTKDMAPLQLSSLAHCYALERQYSLALATMDSAQERARDPAWKTTAASPLAARTNLVPEVSVTLTVEYNHILLLFASAAHELAQGQSLSTVQGRVVHQRLTMAAARTKSFLARENSDGGGSSGTDAINAIRRETPTRVPLASLYRRTIREAARRLAELQAVLSSKVKRYQREQERLALTQEQWRQSAAEVARLKSVEEASAAGRATRDGAD